MKLPDLYAHLYEMNNTTGCLNLTEDKLGILPKVVRYAPTQREDIRKKAPYCLETRANEMFTGLEPIVNSDGSSCKSWYKGNHVTYKEGKKVRNATLIYYPEHGDHLMLFYACGWFPKRGFSDLLASRMINFIKKTRPIEVGAYKLESLDR